MTSFWPTHGQLKCMLACYCIGNLVYELAYRWSFVFYDVIFYRHFKKVDHYLKTDFLFKV